MKGRDEFGVPGLDGRIILKWILEKESLRFWASFG
jgi:hypothetical protein